MDPTPANPSRQWTFLSNHAHVLVCLAADCNTRLRDVAVSVGITERAVQKIVADLETAGVILRERCGRRNSYRLNAEMPLRHPLESHSTVGTLLAALGAPGQESVGRGKALQLDRDA
jgi:Uncharacterized membrane-associated protein/domain